MRIAVDATPCFNERGYGRFARELLRSMSKIAEGHDLVLLADARDAETLRRDFPDVRVRGAEVTDRPTEAASSRGRRTLGDMLAMRSAAKDERPDVIFYPTVYTFFPAPPGARAVVTVHDAIAERFPHLTLPSAHARLFWRLKVKLALSQSRLVLTVSDFAAEEIAEVLHVPRERIRVSGEAPAPAFRPGATPAEIAAVAASAGLPPGARYIVYVGGFNPHKRVDGLARAHARLARELSTRPSGEPSAHSPRESPARSPVRAPRASGKRAAHSPRESPASSSRGPSGPPHLVLVGTRDRDAFHTSRGEIEAAIDAGGAGHLVHWAGFVPDEELRALHCGALLCALPSECEGFGLPVVEAAACGTPVVATTRSPLPQLLDGGGIFVAPRDEDGLLSALRTLCTDEERRAAMGRAALTCARALSWDRAARAALDAIEEAVR